LIEAHFDMFKIEGTTTTLGFDKHISTRVRPHVDLNDDDDDDDDMARKARRPPHTLLKN